MRSPLPGPAALAPAGPAAGDVATLWWAMLAVGTVVFAVVAGLFVVGARRRPRPTGPDSAGPDPGDRGDVPGRMATGWIVGLGVVMPAVVLVGVLVASVVVGRSVSRAAPSDAVRIEVVAYQYWWEAHYPGTGVTVANELHVPVGRPVELVLTSADVIHSFWVPRLQGKLDMLPDGPNTLVLEADRPGEYLGACAEFCGIQHANMAFLVIAEPAADFDEWLARQAEPSSAAADEAAQRGGQVFLTEGCASCHRVRGLAGAPEPDDPGPDLTHLAGRRTLAADTVANTEDQLRRWLADPGDVKPGTTMPDPDLSPAQLADLVAFLRGLR